MDVMQAWKQFERSGQIQDYLRYSQLVHREQGLFSRDGENHADHHNGNGTSGTQLGG